MWRATIKGLMARKVRLALTAFSIVVGVAFVAGTFILTDTIGKAFDNLFSTVEKGVAVEVTGVPKFQSHGLNSEEAGSAQRVPTSLLGTIRAVPDVSNFMFDAGVSASSARISASVRPLSRSTTQTVLFWLPVSIRRPSFMKARLVIASWIVGPR